VAGAVLDALAGGGSVTDEEAGSAAGAGVLAAAGAGAAGARAGAVIVWTATRCRRATSEAFDGPPLSPSARTITAVDNAALAATMAICGQVSRVDRTRRSITR
jgi:hypothetical protein